MRVQLIDPSADVLPYDHALAAALARRGAGVELVTSRFVHGPAPSPDGYAVAQSFYRLATGPAAARPRLRRAQAGRARARHAAPAPPSRDGRPPALAVALARGRDHAAAPARPAPGVDHAQRDQARSLRAPPRRPHGRRDRPHPARRRAARRRPARARDPPRRVRAPHPQADERPLPPELAAVQGPVVLCFGVVRPYKGIDVLVEAFRSIAGAELWVVGRPLGVSIEALDARQRALRAALRGRRRAARLFPPGRPARAPAPLRGRVGRAVRRPGVRQGDGALRRGRLPRAGGGARRRRGWSRRAIRRRSRRRSASCSPIRPSASASPSAPGPPPPGRTPGTRSRSARWPSTRRCSRDEGRVHGQEQALGRAGARLAGGPRRGGGRRRGPRARTTSPTSSSGSTSPPAVTGCR